MTVPGRQFHLRLSPEHTQRLHELQEEFTQIPQPTLLKLVLGAVLDMPLCERIEAISNQMRRPTKQRQSGRLQGPLNSKNRMG